MIKTNLFSILLIFTRATTKNVPRVATATGRVKTGPVRAVFVIHVGGTRCVTWSIDRIVQRHACITWGVELILAIFFIFFLYV